jgi:tetraacyldisaccharide-1-P 4'-kinase
VLHVACRTLLFGYFLPAGEYREFIRQKLHNIPLFST